jgi:membrane associated rhomboid family serine protease
MILPLRTDRRLRTTPIVNYAIITINVLVFLYTMNKLEQESVRHFFLHPEQPHWYQFVTSTFLHGDFGHIAGNMLLLYVFGNNVEDRLGHVGYALFYLAAGVLACLGHAAMESAPVLGASGAVSGVTGMFLALFPRTRITVIFFMIIIGFFQIPATMLILLWFAQDAFFYIQQFGGVAYLAHLSGSFFGFAVGMFLLKSRLLAREPYDMLTLLEHRRRRSRFTALTSQGYKPWEQESASAMGSKKDDAPAPLTPQEQAIMDKRAQISTALSSHNPDRAAELYAELLDRNPAQVLGQQNQIDIANHFASIQQFELAARAYELLLNTYATLPDREKLELMLALIYQRYLKRGQRARELLNSAIPKMRDADELKLAKSLLGELDEN